MSEARDLSREELEEVLEDGEEMPEVTVLDDASAEMLMDRIRWADEQYARMENWYAKQLEKAKEIHDRTVGWAERELRAYFDMVPKKRTKTQESYDLPSGKLVLKEQQPKYSTKDEELVPWLKANKMTDLVKIKEEANWAELKKQLKVGPDMKSMVTEDGEVVPGVTVEVRMPKFEAKLNK